MKKIVQLFKFLLSSPLFRQLGDLWAVLTASWQIYRDKRVPVEKLTSFLKAASIPSFDFLIFLVCATLIATLGLLANNSAVIIGGMVVAPLMNPILGISFAIVTGNWSLYRRSMLTVFFGVGCAISVSYLISETLPINVVGSEIVARTSPNLIDLGIAMAAGAAGALALTRSSLASSIVAGVAIAVALAPPLCVVGIGMGIGDNLAAEIDLAMVIDLSVASGAFLLFLTNLTGIILIACLVFLALSYGSVNKALPSLLIWFLIIALLSVPLTNSLKEVFLANRVSLEIKKNRRGEPELEQKNQIRHIDVRLEDTTAYITVLFMSTESLTDRDIDERFNFYEKRMFDSISKIGVTEMKVKIRYIPVQIRSREYELRNPVH